MAERVSGKGEASKGVGWGILLDAKMGRARVVRESRQAEKAAPAEKASGKKAERPAGKLDATGRDDFRKYAQAHGIKSAGEMKKWSQERLQAFGRDFSEWRRLKTERMRNIKGNDYYIRNSEDVISREINYRTEMARREMDGIANRLRRARNAHVENERQQAFVDAETERLEKEYKRARAKYEDERDHRGKRLTGKQKEHIEYEQENLRRFREADRLGTAEKKMWEAGADGDKVRYSVEQRRVMDESALLTKMRQELAGIPAWKIGEKRAMKKRILAQKATLDRAVGMLMEAQGKRKGERGWMAGGESVEKPVVVEVAARKLAETEPRIVEKAKVPEVAAESAVREEAGEKVVAEAAAVEESVRRPKHMRERKEPKHMGPERTGLWLVKEPKHMRERKEPKHMKKDPKVTRFGGDGEPKEAA